MQTQLLELPWHIQLALAAGYAGYLVAYLGARSHHRTHDVVFLSLLFSLIASSVYSASKAASAGLIQATALAVSCTIFAGIFWRKWGCVWWQKFIRTLNIAHSDDTISALGGLQLRTDTELTGVAVCLADGSWLMCDDTSAFSRCAYPAFTIGEKGDVLMYVSSQCDPTGENKNLESTLHEAYGDRLTYIPSDRISRINMRFRKVTSRPSTEAASADRSLRAS